MEFRDWMALAGFVVVAAGGLLGFGGLITALRRVIEDVDDLKDHHDKTRDALASHTADGERHVNHLHMRAIEQRMERLETGQQRIEEKIDKLTERVLEK
ncbi:MAG TPA: hypothetical protein PKO33_05150 [Pyrinomonadaceae bacterium]|jgi:hypothetical protein|nr:hypothetical protein [Pyrinomonadaceae bacterium]